MGVQWYWATFSWLFVPTYGARLAALLIAPYYSIWLSRHDAFRVLLNNFLVIGPPLFLLSNHAIRSRVLHRLLRRRSIGFQCKVTEPLLSHSGHLWPAKTKH